MSSLTDVQDTLLASSPALALALVNAYEMGRGPQPNYQPTADDLEDAFMATDAVKDVDGYDFIRKENPSRVDSFQNPDNYGLNERIDDLDNVHRIKYNPSAHPAYLAHEMGHTAAQQDGFGKTAYQFRHGDFGGGDADKFTRRFAKAMPGIDIGMAGAVAALTPGDDDLASSILSSYVGYSPQIADELMASLKAQEILKQSHGGVMPRGSRARLAGALGTYLAAPALTGSIANYAGNLIDDEIVGPPSNTANVA